MNTITLTHHGRTVALAAPARFWLAAEIEALPDNHPRKRRVCLMALDARDILTGAMPDPTPRPTPISSHAWRLIRCLLSRFGYARRQALLLREGRYLIRVISDSSRRGPRCP